MSTKEHYEALVDEALLRVHFTDMATKLPVITILPWLIEVHRPESMKEKVKGKRGEIRGKIKVTLLLLRLKKLACLIKNIVNKCKKDKDGL